MVQNVLNREILHDQEETGRQANLEDILDLAQISSVKGVLNLKDYSLNFSNSVGNSNASISEDSPFVEVAVNGKKAVIKKSSLCWLLENPPEKVSADRIKRFIVKKTDERNDLLKKPRGIIESNLIFENK